MQREHRDRFGPDVVRVSRVQRIHERCGRTIELEVLPPQHERHREDHDTRGHGYEPIAAGQDAVQLQPLPCRVLAFEIQIERLVVRPVAKMMPEMPLAQQVKRRRKEHRERDAGGLVDAAVAEEHPVFRLVDRGVDRVHHHREGKREQQQPAARLHGPRGKEACRDAGALRRHHQRVQDVRDAILLPHQWCRPAGRGSYPRSTARIW